VGDRGALAEHGLVGRDRELERFDQLQSQLRSGRGGAIALPGDPGVGKTRLLAAYRSRAEATGLALLGCTGRDGEMPDPAQVAVAARGAAEGVVVCLDDLHRLPVEGNAVVDELLQLAATDPVLVALAYRPRQLGPALAALLSRADTAGALWRAPLGPLTPTETEAVAGDHPDRHRIAAASAGNPLYLRILMEPTAEAAGPLLGEIAELGAAAQLVARVAATLGDPFSLELLMAACPLGSRAVAAALDALVAADLVRPVAGEHLTTELTFRHPVVARVIYENSPLGHRRDTHRRIDATLFDRGESAIVRAPHLVAAGDPERTDHVDTLLAAARQVLATDPATSATWARAAGELAPAGDRSRIEAQLLVARARLLTGEADETRAALQAIPPEHLRALDTDPSAVASIAALAERLLGNYPEAETLAQEGLAMVGDGPEPAAVPLHCELASIALYRGDHPAATHHAATVAEIARGRGEGAYEACALAATAWAHANSGEFAAVASVVAKATRVVDGMPDAALAEHLDCLFQLSCIENLIERNRDARRHAARGVALCRRTGQLHLMASLLMALGIAQLPLGELAAAFETFDEAAHYAAREEASAIRGIVAVFRAHARFWLEDSSPDRAVAEADQAVDDSSALPRLFAVVVRSTAGGLLVSAGEHERGSRLLLAVGGGPELPHVPAIRRARMWESLAIAALAAGDSAAAEHHADLARQRIDDVPLRGYRGFIERTQLLVHGARRNLIAMAETAADHFAAAELWPTAGVTELAAATAGLDAGWHDQPERTEWVAERLSRARELAARCGSARLAAQVEHAEARRSAAIEPRWARPLTTREREIARLASAGITSAEIARRLYISVRTVDNHLGRIYRKLDISTRSALVHLVLTGRPSSHRG
jgi:DNA-binding CsgD family transcriptional regulator/tetratricopeptide (TPR) repeat protein